MRGIRTTRAILTLASVVALAGCGIQSTSVNTFVAQPVTLGPATPSTGESTAPAGANVYWLYFLQAPNQLTPVKRTSATPVSLQDLVNALVQGPSLSEQQQGTYSGLKLQELTISLTSNVQQYALDFPSFNYLSNPAKSQLACTVWYWARQHRAPGSTLGTSVRFVSGGQTSSWVDCWQYTDDFDPGNLFAGGTDTSAAPEAVTKAGLTSVPVPGM